MNLNGNKELSINKLSNSLVSVCAIFIFALVNNSYAQGNYILEKNRLVYTIKDSDYTGSIILPSILIQCPRNDVTTLSFKLKIKNYKQGNIIDIGILDKDNNKSNNQIKRLVGEGPTVLNFSSHLGDLELKSFSSLWSQPYPYSTKKVIMLNGQFNSTMSLEFYNMSAVSDEKHIECKLNWLIGVE